MNNSINNNDAEKFAWKMAFIFLGVLANLEGFLYINIRIRKLTMENVFSVLLLLNNVICCFVVGPQYLKGTPYKCPVLELSVSYWVITNMFIVMMISIDQFYVTIDQRHEHLIVDVFKMVKTLICIGIIMIAVVMVIVLTSYPSPGVWALCTVNKPYMFRPFGLKELSSFIVGSFFFASFFVICFLNLYITEVYYIFLVQQYLRVPGASFLGSLWRVFTEVWNTSKPAQLSYGVVAYCLITQFPAANLHRAYYASDFPVFFLLAGVLLSPYLFVINNSQQITGELCTYFPNPMQGTLLQNKVLRLIQVLVQPAE